MSFTPFSPAILADTSHAGYKLHWLKSLLNDKASGNGPHPDGSNFEDEELNNFLAVSGGAINGAFIQAARALASSWSSFALGERNATGQFDAKEVAATWEERAEKAMKTPIDSATGKKFAFQVF